MDREFMGERIAYFDCSMPVPSGQFYCSEGTEVRQTEIGKYWETSGKLNSEFGFRFSIRHLDKPHLCVMRYPDDKKRYIGISDCMTYDLSGGISTGGVYPVSHEIKQAEMVFWARNSTENISFVTMNEGDAAALVSLEIYELKELPQERLPSGTEFRRLGIQFEDPCGKCISLGASTFSEWKERLIAYMKASGQNELYYPVNWYHGPNFPSKTQPADMFDVCFTQDRKQYCRGTVDPPDWVEDFLTSFDEHDIRFTATFTLSRLGTLLADMNADEESVVLRGKETYNNMRGDDRLQNAINDWTIVYNARHIPKLLQKAQENENVLTFRGVELAYGERMSDIGIGPMFNPIHPKVQNTILEYLTEFVRRYSKHSSLRCLSMNIWHSSLFWFGTLDFGYDDYTVPLFEREEQIDLDIESTDPKRFSKRKNILLEKYREQWIGWRCRKITQFIETLRNEIRAVSPRIRLAFNFWNEMVKPSLFGGIRESVQLYERENDYEFLREAGMDIVQIGALEGVEVCIENNHQRDITNLFTRNGKKPPIEQGFMFRDFDFMDDVRNNAVKQALNPSAFIFNCWEESWGKVTVHPVADRCELPYDVTHWTKQNEAEIIYEQKSDKHLIDFWYDWQIVIVAAFPPSPYYMEYYAHSLADLDARSISSGGLYVDTMHTDELKSFAQEYRLLPDVKFEDVSGENDPLTVRYCRYGEKTYIYAVNKSPLNIKGKIGLDRRSNLLRPTQGKIWEAEEIIQDFSPFELKVFTSEDGVKVMMHSAEACDSRADILMRLGESVLRDLGNASAGKGIVATKEKLKKALERRAYASIYHILTGYTVSKLKGKIVSDWQTGGGM